METFLLTYQSFTTANELLQKLIDRYHIPWNASKSWQSFEHNRNISQLRVCNLFLTWTKKYTSDFVWNRSTEEAALSDKRATMARPILPLKSGVQTTAMKRGFVSHLLSFLETVLAHDHPMMARQIRRNIVRLQDEKRRRAAFSAFRILHPEDITPESREAILSHSSEEIARHLTHIEFILYSKIMPPELLNQAWTKVNADIKAKNIMAITKRFNSVACWVCKSVVEKKDAKSRGKVIARFIDVASVCY